MKIIACYDISDNKRLNKIARIMKDYGTRVQYSVFELDVEEYVLKKLMKRVEKIIEKEVDSVRYYKLCFECENSLDIIGSKVYSEKTKEFYLL